MKENKVFITYADSISTLGIGNEESNSNLSKGLVRLKSPEKDDKFIFPYFPVYGDLKQDKTLTKSSQLSLSLLNMSEKYWLNNGDYPLFLATSTGGIKETEDNYKAMVNGTADYKLFRNHFFDVITNDINDKYKNRFKDAFTFSTACSSAGHGVMQAFKFIKSGLIDKAVIIGYDILSMTTMIGFHSLKLVSETGSIPLSADRNGLTLGDGAGIIILEKEPKTNPIGEVTGCSSYSDGYHISSPEPEGLIQIKCISEAINESGIKPEDIDYVSAHGTGTLMNDDVEMRAIRSFFKHNPVVTSLKGYIGHTLGASAAVEIALVLCMIKDGYIYQPSNFKNSMNKDLIPEKSINHKVKYFLKNSFGFGGNNVCMVIKNLQ